MTNDKDLHDLLASLAELTDVDLHGLIYIQETLRVRFEGTPQKRVAEFHRAILRLLVDERDRRAAVLSDAAGAMEGVSLDPTFDPELD